MGSVRSLLREANRQARSPESPDKWHCLKQPQKLLLGLSLPPPPPAWGAWARECWQQ